MNPYMIGRIEMGLFGSPAPAVPTFDERFVDALSQRDSALSRLRRERDEVVNANDSLTDLIDEVETEVSRLTSLRDRAFSERKTGEGFVTQVNTLLGETE